MGYYSGIAATLREVPDEELAAEVKRRETARNSYRSVRVPSSVRGGGGGVIEMFRYCNSLHISCNDVAFFIEDAKDIVSHLSSLIAEAEDWRANT